MCHNISMQKNSHTQREVIEAEIIEPEILDENGQSVSVPGGPSAPRAHGDVYGRVGLLTGFFAIAFSCVMLILGFLVTVFIVAPLILIGRLLGLQIKKLHR